MGDPHVGPSPGGAAMVEGGDQPVKIGDANLIVHKIFSRSFIHYIDHFCMNDSYNIYACLC